MVSIKSKLFSLILRLVIKGNLEKELETGKINRKRDVPMPPAKLQQKFKISTKQINEKNIFTLSPKNNATNKIVLYLHGGAYVHNFAKQHWEFIGTLIENLQCNIVAPDYPLAPDHTYKESFAFIEPLYKELVARNNSNNFILMGDSAGGGFALALAQKMKNENLSQPSKIILLSPWLDISTTNPDIPAIESKDPFLAVKGLQLAGEAYAGTTEVNNYLLSPINGRLEGLGKIFLFMGTHDVLSADAKRFKTLCDSIGVDISYYEYKEMIHCWMLLGFPESKKAIKQIVEIVKTQ